MISIKINNTKFLVKAEISVLEACKYLGITIPRFCYHETLSVAGNCRMCLVELENIEKPVASCVTIVENGMSIWVNTPFVKKARENVVETLLINHPLDCPICDQAGECDLQDQTKNFGSNYTRFFFNKRGVEDKNCGPLIKTIMTRCIHCTRCVRFGSEIAGVDYLITLNRGTSTEIGSYTSKLFDSEISGNVIDLCPVGALTSKPYAFKARPWELRLSESVDTTDSTGSNLYINFKESEISRIVPKTNSFINQSIVSDKTRFSYDAIKNNRIKSLFEYNNKDAKFTGETWNGFFDKVDHFLEENNSLTIFINDELDLETINFIKKLNSGYSNRIKMKTVSKDGFENNIYVSGSGDKIIDIERETDICFLLSYNSRLESTILNARLRFKYKNSNLKIAAIGQVFRANIPTNFIHLNIKNLIKSLEGKVNLFSKMILLSKHPLFFIGGSLESRSIDSNYLISFIKSKFENSKVIKVNSACNSEGASLLNVKRSNKKDFHKATNAIFVNLDDLLKLRKSFDSFRGKSIWLNTHGSKVATKSNFILPTLTVFEEEQILLNLEGRPQKTQKTFESFFNARSVKSILVSICNMESYSACSRPYLDFLYEVLDNPEKFESLNSKLLIKGQSMKASFSNLNIISNYPMKSSIEDFYCSNVLTRNSLTMLKCSQLRRNTSTNFEA